MATSVVDALNTDVFSEPHRVSDGLPRSDRAVWLSTLFGAASLVAFLSYVALASTTVAVPPS